MKTNKDLAEGVERIERGVVEIREDVRVHEYCRVHGMNYRESGDYARAVNGLAKERRNAGGTSVVLLDGNETKSRLLKRKPVGAADCSCYNKDKTATRILRLIGELDEVSRYGWFDDIDDRMKRKWEGLKDDAKKAWGEVKESEKKAWNETKELGNRAKDEITGAAKAVWKASGGRRNIENNTEATICVTGNTKDGKTKLIYLRAKGATSSPDLYDADGVVILPGQKFYATEGEMKRKGTKHTTGVIKVKDALFGLGNAEVCNAPGEKDTYYVNAMGTSYLTLEEAGRKLWKLP